MYYEKTILPIDTKGNFLLAIHYPSNKIGGEISQESRHAYFAYGNVDTPEALKEITPLCCLPREPSLKDAEYFRNISKAQRTLAEDPLENKSSRKHFQENAWKYGYQAQLALEGSQYVPRTVLASPNGTLAVGFDIEEAAGGGSATLRIINIPAEKVLSDHHENWGPQANALCHPLAIATDGRSLITRNIVNKRNVQFAEKSLPDLTPGTAFTQPVPTAHFCAGNGIWIAIGDNVHLIESGTSKLIDTLPLPKGAFAWGFDVAQEGQIIAFTGDKGQISLLDLNTGKTKKYFPHRGCKRDDIADIKISPNGQWMVSRIRKKKEMMVTRLDDGITWYLDHLEDEVIDEKVEGEFRSQSHIPAAFAFIGSRLLISDSHKARELTLEEPQDKELMFVSEQGKTGARIPIKIPAKPTFEKLIEAAKLERISDEIKRYYSPGVILKTKKPKKSGWLMPGNRGAVDLAISRFGGWPDLPKGTDWPTWQNRPMCFLAQVNLEDIYAAQPDIRLPKQGLLLFFLGCGDESYENEAGKRETYMADPMLGVDSTHKDAWRVIYADSNTTLQRATYDALPAPDIFAPCLLSISRGGMPIPDENSAAYQNIPFKQDERDNFNEIVDLFSSNDWQNQLMGYPNLIQFTPPDMQCVQASNGNDPYSFPPEGSGDYQKLINAASEWGLLLQLTSDDNPGFIWGDGGHLYFYGKRSEMETGDFSNVWICFECH